MQGNSLRLLYPDIQMSDLLPEGSMVRSLEELGIFEHCIAEQIVDELDGRESDVPMMPYNGTYIELGKVFDHIRDVVPDGYCLEEVSFDDKERLIIIYRRIM